MLISMAMEAQMHFVILKMARITYFTSTRWWTLLHETQVKLSLVGVHILKLSVNKFGTT